jgi:hypothetical protein
MSGFPLASEWPYSRGLKTGAHANVFGGFHAPAASLTFYCRGDDVLEDEQDVVRSSVRCRTEPFCDFAMPKIRGFSCSVTIPSMIISPLLVWLVEPSPGLILVLVLVQVLLLTRNHCGTLGCLGPPLSDHFTNDG